MYIHNMLVKRNPIISLNNIVRKAHCISSFAFISKKNLSCPDIFQCNLSRQNSLSEIYLDNNPNGLLPGSRSNSPHTSSPHISSRSEVSSPTREMCRNMSHTNIPKLPGSVEEDAIIIYNALYQGAINGNENGNASNFINDLEINKEAHLQSLRQKVDKLLISKEGDRFARFKDELTKLRNSDGTLSPEAVEYFTGPIHRVGNYIDHFDFPMYLRGTPVFLTKPEDWDKAYKSPFKGTEDPVFRSSKKYIKLHEKLSSGLIGFLNENNLNNVQKQLLKGKFIDLAIQSYRMSDQPKYIEIAMYQILWLYVHDDLRDSKDTPFYQNSKMVQNLNNALNDFITSSFELREEYVNANLPDLELSKSVSEHFNAYYNKAQNQGNKKKIETQINLLEKLTIQYVEVLTKAVEKKPEQEMMIKGIEAYFNANLIEATAEESMPTLMEYEKLRSQNSACLVFNLNGYFVKQLPNEYSNDFQEDYTPCHLIDSDSSLDQSNEARTDEETSSINSTDYKVEKFITKELEFLDKNTHESFGINLYVAIHLC